MASLIQENRIQVNYFAKNQFAAIEMAAKPLIEQGFVSEGFFEAVMEREKNFPTGLPTSVGVALPHTEAKFVVNESISILTLEKPVVFAGMGNPKEEVQTEIIFLLAINNPVKQINILQTIITIIQNKKMLEHIKGARDPKTIYRLINQFL
ncbi:MAG: PTS sugar transporter subunit IIA [Acetobacterium sp.]